ncbi:unnamed protein product [Parnassius apollo]|uniref:(apollo) hypothetical protein n=1 Tax=Parnassius apollo TaxID=110799 RepID=A0A8S3XZ34_PARAO|nr:unnamed protein product [Parnassius apollo]
MSKATFNKIFSQVWPKCMTHSNIVNGFAATGLFPFNPEAIPEEAYAPSVLSEIAWPQTSVEPIQSPLSDVILNDDTDDELPICAWLLQNSTSDVLKIDEYLDLNKPTETDLVPIVPSTTENSSIVKCRLVDYSSSPDVSDFEMVEHPHRPATQVEEHCASPSLISENDVFLVSANDEPLLSNKDTYKIDLGVPSCFGLHKPIRPSSSSNSTVSDLDALVYTSLFKKCTAEDIYSYSSAEDDENTDYFIPKGQITKKLIISSSHEMYKTNNENFSASDGDYNINLNKQSDKTPFPIFLPTPNYAQVKTKR